MSDHRGFDAAFPPTNPVPFGYDFAGIYTWGPNALRITPVSEQHALASAGYRLFAYGVGYNSCPRCVGTPMDAATGTAHGHAFAAASKARGLMAVCYDWEAGGDKTTGRPSTELLPGWVEYATAVSQAAKDAGCFVGHYGRPEQLGKLMPAEGGNAVMDFIVLTDWTNSPADNPISLWWRQRVPRFCRQYGGADPLDFLICSQEFFDMLDPNAITTAGPMQPVEPTSITFPDYGGPHVIGGGIYQSWKARGGVDGPGKPLNDEHPFTGRDGRAYTAQDFERGRAEYAPDVQAPWNVQWALVNLELLAAQAELAAAPKPPDLAAINTALDAVDTAHGALTTALDALERAIKQARFT